MCVICTGIAVLIYRLHTTYFVGFGQERICFPCIEYLGQNIGNLGLTPLATVPPHMTTSLQSGICV
jgi:hypothetical protein